MPDGFLILLFALELEDQDLVAPAFAHYRAADSGAGNHLAALLERSLDGEFDFGARLEGQLFDADSVARGNPVLLSAEIDDRVHCKPLCLGARTHEVCRNFWSKYRV